MFPSVSISRLEGWCLLLLSLTVILIGTQLPFNYSARYLDRVRLSRFLHVPPIWEMIGNVVMFLPFGFGFAVVFGITRPRQLWTVLLVGALTSASIEAAQMFLPRSPSLSDIIANTFGTFFGAAAYAVYRLGGARNRSGQMSED